MQIRRLNDFHVIAVCTHRKAHRTETESKNLLRCLLKCFQEKVQRVDGKARNSKIFFADITNFTNHSTPSNANFTNTHHRV